MKKAFVWVGIEKKKPRGKQDPSGVKIMKKKQMNFVGYKPPVVIERYTFFVENDYKVH